jgi:hypothetical protein
MEEKRVQLEEALQALTHRADEMMGKDPCPSYMTLS